MSFDFLNNFDEILKPNFNTLLSIELPEDDPDDEEFKGDNNDIDNINNNNDAIARRTRKQFPLNNVDINTFFNTNINDDLYLLDTKCPSESEFSSSENETVVYHQLLSSIANNNNNILLRDNNEEYHPPLENSSENNMFEDDNLKKIKSYTSKRSHNTKKKKQSLTINNSKAELDSLLVDEVIEGKKIVKSNGPVQTITINSNRANEDDTILPNSKLYTSFSNSHYQLFSSQLEQLFLIILQLNAIISSSGWIFQEEKEDGMSILERTREILNVFFDEILKEKTTPGLSPEKHLFNSTNFNQYYQLRLNSTTRLPFSLPISIIYSTFRISNSLRLNNLLLALDSNNNTELHSRDENTKINYSSINEKADRFTDTEDLLLNSGLKRFAYFYQTKGQTGSSRLSADWKKIQQNYLPTKTCYQIKKHYRNSRYRGKLDVLTHLENGQINNLASLNSNQIEILRSSIDKYAKNKKISRVIWKKIQKNVFPNVDLLLLQQAYNLYIKPKEKSNSRKMHSTKDTKTRCALKHNSDDCETAYLSDNSSSYEVDVWDREDEKENDFNPKDSSSFSHSSPMFSNITIPSKCPIWSKQADKTIIILAKKYGDDVSKWPPTDILSSFSSQELHDRLILLLSLIIK